MRAVLSRVGSWALVLAVGGSAVYAAWAAPRPAADEDVQTEFSRIQIPAEPGWEFRSAPGPDRVAAEVAVDRLAAAEVSEN